MARPTFSVRGLVLRRTKLGESDVIVTLLAQDGSQLRAVAKGARKPTSSFASRLELFSVCDLLLVSGKSLDIVKEARLVEGNDHLRGSLDLVEAASPMVELLDKTTQSGLVDGRLFPMACAALSSLSKVGEGRPEESNALGLAERAAVVCAAELLKTSAVLGFCPRFDVCVGCGASLDLSHVPGTVPFSFVDGGLVCDSCLGFHETVGLSTSVAAWAQALMFSTFEQVMRFDIPRDVIVGILRFLQMWSRQHLGVKLVSLDFLLGSFV